MTGIFGLGYLIWIAIIVSVACLLRAWYASDRRRSQLVFWVFLTLICPPLALFVYIFMRLLRIRVDNGARLNG